MKHSKRDLSEMSEKVQMSDQYTKKDPFAKKNL